MNTILYATLILVSFCSALGARYLLHLMSATWLPFLEKLDFVVIIVFLALPWWLLYEVVKSIKHEQAVDGLLRNQVEQNRREEQDVILRHYPLLQSPDDSTGIRSRKELDQYFESHAYEHEIFL